MPKQHESKLCGVRVRDVCWSELHLQINIAYYTILKRHEGGKGTGNEKMKVKWRCPIMRRGGNNYLALRSLAVEYSLRVQNTLVSVRIPILPLV